MPDTPPIPEDQSLPAPAPADADATPSPAEAGSPEIPTAAEIHPEISPETPKEHAPMLEVHAPHEAVHTWKDFFIHIATIVIGLLIAIGLEQTVEYFHHRELATQAREKLTAEMDLNRNITKLNLYSLKLHQNYLFADLPVIQRARARTLAPSDVIVVWHPYNGTADDAWQTLHESDAASLLPYDELHHYSRVYRSQEMFNTLVVESAVALLRAQSMFYRSDADRFVYKPGYSTANGFGENGDAAAHKAFEDQAPGRDKIARLTPAQLDRLEQTIQQGIYDDDRLINLCTTLQRRYAEFAKDGTPAPDPGLFGRSQ